MPGFLGKRCDYKNKTASSLENVNLKTEIVTENIPYPCKILLLFYSSYMTGPGRGDDGVVNVACLTGDAAPHWFPFLSKLWFSVASNINTERVVEMSETSRRPLIIPCTPVIPIVSGCRYPRGLGKTRHFHAIRVATHTALSRWP